MAMTDPGGREKRQSTFVPNEHVIQLKSKEGMKDYLPVQWRLVWFRENCPNGTIETEEIEVDLDREVSEEAYVWNSEKRRSEKVTKVAKGYARFKATVTDGRGGKATGTKSENAASFPDFIEKSETGSIGRALAALGYGTQFAPEFNEEHRIVDSPVEQSTEETRRDAGDKTTAAVVPTPVSTRPSAQGVQKKEPVLPPAPEEQEELAIYQEHLGPFEWAFLLKESLVKEPANWNKMEVLRLLDACRKWQDSVEQVSWRAGKLLPEQSKEFDRLVKAYTPEAVKDLRDSFPAFKGISSLDFTRGLADSFLALFYQAEPTFALQRQYDPALVLARTQFKNVKHVLSFLKQDRLDAWGTLEQYHQALLVEQEKHTQAA